MVFGADKKLIPSSEANLELAMASGSFKGGQVSSYGHMVNAPGSSSDMAPGSNGPQAFHSSATGENNTRGSASNVL